MVGAPIAPIATRIISLPYLRTYALLRSCRRRPPVPTRPPHPPSVPANRPPVHRSPPSRARNGEPEPVQVLRAASCECAAPQRAPIPVKTAVATAATRTYASNREFHAPEDVLLLPAAAAARPISPYCGFSRPCGALRVACARAAYIAFR
eukprot:IDg12677t1